MGRTRSGRLGVPGSCRRRAKSDTHHRFVYERPAKPLSGCFAIAFILLLRAPLAGLFDLASASGGGPISVEPHARSLGAGPSKPLETRGECGANSASVRRVAPRIDLSNAWS